MTTEPGRHDLRGPDSLALMRAAVEQASDAIVITSAELDAPGPEIVYVNPAFTRMTGYSAEEVLGRNPRLLQGRRTDRLVLDRLRAACARGQLFEGRTYNYRKDGSEYLLEWQIAPIRDADGTITHFVAIQQDVTAVVQLEAQFRQAQKMEAVGRLAGGVAHDFNNLLMVITASTHFARENLPPDHPALAELSAIEASAARATSLTRQLLAFSRQQVRQPEVLDLNVVVAGVERLLTRVIGADVRLRVDLASGAVPVLADPGQLEQVLMNLVVNARDAMPDGGELRIVTEIASTAALPAGRAPDAVTATRMLPPSALPPSPVALLRVVDTGEGMDAQTLERVFEPFFTTKEPGKGTGLGLATVHGIVAQSGGTAWIESTRHVGTTVFVALPLVDRRATPALQVRAVASPQPASGQVLLVEDDDSVRSLTRRLLQRAGYTVVEARDARTAIARWAEHEAPGAPTRIDVLVTDMVMPEGSGFELIVRLRTARPDLPVVLLSGYAPDARVESALAMGEARTVFLEKPFSAEALSERIARVLGRG